MKNSLQTLKPLTTCLMVCMVFTHFLQAQTCTDTEIGIQENDFPQTCVSTAADDQAGGTMSTASFTYEAGFTANGAPDVMVTMAASCSTAANDGDGNVTTVAACLGPLGLETNIATPNTDPFDLVQSGGSDFGYVTINDDACASCIVEVCYDFINGFSSDAQGLDIDWSSMNGSTEGQESFVGWIEGTNNTTGATLPTYNSGLLTDGSYCHAQTLQGITAAQHLTGVGTGMLPAGAFGADAITGDGVATACPAEEPDSSSGPNSSVGTGMGDNVIAPNWGFGTDDITVTRLCMVYFGSNNNADDCNGDGATEVNTAPSGSLADVDICFEEPSCPDDLNTTTSNLPTITNSICQSDAVTVGGGSVAAATDNCPAGSTLEYASVPAGDPAPAASAFSTTVPTYMQTDAIDIYTRCACDIDDTMVSPTSMTTTIPGNCCSVTGDILITQVCGELTISAANIMDMGLTGMIDVELLVNGASTMPATIVTVPSGTTMAAFPGVFPNTGDSYSLVLTDNGAATCTSTAGPVLSPPDNSPNVPVFIPNNPTTGN